MGGRPAFRLYVGLIALGLGGCQCQNAFVSVYPHIVVTPSSLNFGTITTGSTSQLAVDVTDESRVMLTVGSVKLQATNDITIVSTLTKSCTGSARTTTDSSELAANECAEIVVQFNASMVESISNVLLIPSNDPKNPLIKVPVTAVATFTASPQVQVCVLNSSGNVVAAQCSNLTATPPFVPTIAFGSLLDGQTASQTIRVISTGNVPLDISSMALSSTSADLTLTQLPMFPDMVAQTMYVDAVVTFAPTQSGSVTGDVVIVSNATGNPHLNVPITAIEQMMQQPPGCMPPTASVTASVGSTTVPASGVLQNTTVTLAASTSGGSGTISGYTWTIISAPAGSTSTITGTGASTTLNCSEPGTYEVGVVANNSSGCPSMQATVSITVDAAPPTCGPSTQFIYTIDESGVLSSFFPGTSTFTTIGTVECVTLSTPNTMAVDRQGIAWVEYADGTVFKVNTTTLACYASGIGPGATPSHGWGSCFASDTVGGTTATYYISEGSKLQTINTSTLAVSTVGAFAGLTGVTNDEAELTGTSSANLYGFFPGSPWVLAEINATNGSIMSQQPVAVISNDVLVPGNWAFASWNDDFWFFVGNGTSTSVFHLAAVTGQTTKVTTNHSVIVGAGVSPCVGQ